MSCLLTNDSRKRYCLPLLFLIFTLAIGGCAKDKGAIPEPVGLGQTTPVPEQYSTDRVVVLTASVPSTLDPYHMVSIHPDDSVAAHIWDPLVWLNDDLELEPWLAESWRMVNDLTWELKLRQGVTFHNGEPFNAQAVKFSLERSGQLEGSLETVVRDVALQRVEIRDEYTVRIHTAKPAVSMIYELSSVEMLPPLYYSQTGLDDLAQNPVGSGPYRVVDWDPGRRLVLEAYADHWRGASAINTLVFEAEPDPDERLARLADGDADIATDLSPGQVEAANVEQIRGIAIESTRRLFVGMRSQDGTPLADKRVRQALNYAVDVKALIIEFHSGYGQPYGSWVNAPYGNPDLSPWPYDPEKARDLLAQAGYPDGFEITMDTPVGRYYQDQRIAEAIAARMAVVGVRMTVHPQEWPVYVGERLVPKETAPLFLLSLTSRGNGLEDTKNLAYGFPFNPTLWYNEAFEELLTEAEQTFDETSRLDLLYKAQAIAYEESPWIWLWRPFLFYGVRQGLDWWHPRADGLVFLYLPAPGTTVE